jgi:CheY-like chemotaxis protein
MQERINRLLKAICELRERADHCDVDFRAQFHSLADEMQRSVDEMQQKLTTFTAVHSSNEERLRNEKQARHKKLGKLLLVEDEEALRGLLAEFLEDEGFDVVQAPGCSAALLQLDRDPSIDCVLSDVRMPDGSGFELARSILARRPVAKIALISGFSDELPKPLAQQGVQLFRKPLPLDDLASHVKKLCAA